MIDTPQSEIRRLQAEIEALRKQLAKTEAIARLLEAANQRDSDLFYEMKQLIRKRDEPIWQVNDCHAASKKP